MDTMTEAADSLTTTAMETVRAAYRRALRDAVNAVAALTDGDSPQWDGAIADACRAIESIPLPKEIQ